VGQEIPVSFDVAQEVAEAFNKESPVKKVKDFVEKQNGFFKPLKGGVVIEAGDKFVAVHCFAGSNANEAISKGLAALLTSLTGKSVLVKPSAYGFLMEFSKPPSAKTVKELLEGLAEKLPAVLERVLPKTSLYRHRFLGVAKAFGIVSKKADLKSFSLKRLAEALKDSPVGEEALREVYYDDLDVARAQSFLKKAGFKAVETDEWSPLAKQFFGFGSFTELLVPAEATERVMEAFKENLYAKTTPLACGYCLKTFSRDVKDERSDVYCPYCGSNQVTLKQYKDVLEKRKASKKLSVADKKKLREARRVQSLVSAYGKRALMALETFGVGPEKAATVLARLQDSEERFLADLLEAQKTFIRTKQYWRV